MATLPEHGPVWWDRDVDDKGAPIRDDVRQAAHESWDSWCARVKAVLGDCTEAAELMESSVAHVSRYLTRHGVCAFYPQAKSLLSLHCCQELKRHVGRRCRIQAVGLTAELDALAPTSDNWVQTFDFWHDFQKLHIQVDDRSWIIFAMRHLGHDWPEISEKVGIAISTAQNHFRNHFKGAWGKLNGNSHVPKSNGKGHRK
ncbi:MAG TPA: hypothetical protein VKZ53_19910 [Candidatus Angelobacter sp.]|nr:hypothetical protein [Candidatus Angelobacter sp.]